MGLGTSDRFMWPLIGLQSKVRSHPVEAAVRIGHRLAAPLQQLILAITSYKSAFGAKQIARRRVANCRCREGALK